MEKVLVTGSAGHLGEALAWTLSRRGVKFEGIDIKPSIYTTVNASITDEDTVAKAMEGVDTVLHTATLHKPHVKTHSKQDFIDTNVSGTQTLLSAAIRAGVKRFIFTSTTSTFGHAMRAAESEPAIWVDEELVPDQKNIYGATKLAAEGLCKLAYEEEGLNCLILRTSRFFPEEDDSAAVRTNFSDENSKANEFLNRRAELSDIVEAHFCAANRAEEIGYGLYLISATSPFAREDLPLLNENGPAVVAKYYPDFQQVYDSIGWAMFEKFDRVYDNSKARIELGWQPKYDFGTVLDALRATQVFPKPEVTRFVGKKGYHDEVFEDGPFPV
ncbi:MAG: NAD(P)-dependent oxidoreductase [Pseudomonadales bacterium]|nr:NAD(P)-dependent oxidoreductase [Pseudomonadales bacterium]